MAYRDDHDALSNYHDNLARKLTELEAKAAELDRVEAERDRVARELIRVRADLEQSRARRAAPIRLENLRVAAPCKVPWDSMTGDDRARDCAKCEKTVYNISSMTRAEAEEFLAARGASACVRFFKRADGTILTADCPVGVKKRRRKLALTAGALAGAAGGVAIAATEATAMMGGPAPVVEPHEDILGKFEMQQGGVTKLPEPEPLVEVQGPPPVEVVGEW
jgi:hypothetical protein